MAPCQQWLVMKVKVNKARTIAGTTMRKKTGHLCAVVAKNLLELLDDVTHVRSTKGALFLSANAKYLDRRIPKGIEWREEATLR